jgi:hypothetical protein
MKAESAMKMKEAAMKLERDAAMKKYVSDAQRKAVHASKADKKSGMKLKEKSAMKDANRFGEYHTKETYPGSGGTRRFANEELGKVAHTHKSKTDGTIASYSLPPKATEAKAREEKAKKDKEFKDAKSPAKMGHSPKKMKKSAMKNKSFDDSTNFRQTEKERQEDRGEKGNPKQKRRNFYNEKKARRKAEKSRKADAKAREARAKMEEAVYGKNFENVADGKVKPKTKKEQKAASKASRKAIRTGTRARVAEAVAQRQLSKKGGERGGPERPKREKKAKLAKFRNTPSLTGKRTKLDVVGTLQQRKKDRASGAEDARKARNTKARHEYQLKRRRYRQTQGLRGDINVRRKAKGKDAI